MGEQPSLFLSLPMCCDSTGVYGCLLRASVHLSACVYDWYCFLDTLHMQQCVVMWEDVAGCISLVFVTVRLKTRIKGYCMFFFFFLTFKNCINLLTEEIKVSCTITVWPALLKLDPLTLPEKYLKVLYILSMGCIVCLLLLTLSSKEGSVEDLIYLWSSLFILFSCWHHFHFTLTWLLMCWFKNRGLVNNKNVWTVTSSWIFCAYPVLYKKQT